MEDSLVTTVILPLCLAITMFGIGLGLAIRDFHLLVERPRPVFAGLAAQMLYLPLVGVLIGLVIFDFPSALIGAGFVIITLAPGSSTSNLFTLFAKGDLALSVTLTAITSLLAPFWLPLAASIILNNIDAAQNIELDVVKVFIDLFSVTIIPIIIGMIIKHYYPTLASKLQKPVATFALVFLVLIIIALIIKHLDILRDYTAIIAPAILLLAILAYGGGYLIARLTATTPAQVKSISMEVGIQNAALALLVTASILKIPEMTLAAMFYGLAMYIIGFISVALFNRRNA
ncbi:MAG: bile acid:sodium symporter family protein [Gammaproteobacteria bacterium]|nr:bile acid:sodium symporter family protein [Gammaproteobacteria bacterium]